MTDDLERGVSIRFMPGHHRESTCTDIVLPDFKKKLYYCTEELLSENSLQYMLTFEITLALHMTTLRGFYIMELERR